MALIPFSKYEGCGNDFIFIDNRQCPLHFGKENITHLCHRQLGIGADGVILLEESVRADFCMRIFNADGGEAEMCGNGARCCIKYLQELGIDQSIYYLEIMGKILMGWQQNNLITINMGSVTDIRWNIPLVVEGQSYTVHHLDTGVPHIVLFCDDHEIFPLSALGPQFRHHPHFSPKGANFNVAKISSQGEIFIRTFERGVEAETLACGTGCTAAAIAAAIQHQVCSPIKVHTLAGHIIIEFEIKNHQLLNITMTGPAAKTFSGFFEIKLPLTPGNLCCSSQTEKTGFFKQ